MIFHYRPVKLILILVFLLVFCMGLALNIQPASAATIVVNTEVDTVIPADGYCTLREAMNNANSSGDTTDGDCVTGSSGADTITLPEGTYTLTDELPYLFNSEIVINGAGAQSTIIQASTCNPVTLPGGCTPATYRVFLIQYGGDLSLNDLTVRYGNTTGAGGGIENSGSLTLTNSIITANAANYGGGVRNGSSHDLIMTNSTISGNSADTAGGGIYNYGNLYFTDSIISANSANYGGGISNTSGSFSITNTTISDNTADNDGGAIYSKTDTEANLTITDCTINGNSAGQDSGGIHHDSDTGEPTLILTGGLIDNNDSTRYGGGIYNRCTMEITGSTISNNESERGGGILCGGAGTLDVSECTITGNSATTRGGGIEVGGNASAIVSDTTLSGNSAGTNGGGIALHVDAYLDLTNSTLSGNSAAGNGGGIDNYDTDFLYVTNSTLSENTAVGNGGGIYNYNTATMYLTNATLFANSAAGGGGIYNDGIMHYTNTIVANSSSGGDCYNPHTISTNLNNMVKDGSCSIGGVNFLSGDPLLGPLADNGGLTQTYALLFGSPAIDAGDMAACPETDQRGISRPQGAGCDIGAFEFIAVYLPLIIK